MPSPVPTTHRVELERAPDPRALLPGLAAGRPHLLDGNGPDGWRTPPGGGTAPTAVLAVDPEIEFRGGVEALEEARRWLREHASPDPDAALLIGSLSYELGAAFERLAPRHTVDSSLPAVRLAGFRSHYRYERETRRGFVVGGSRSGVERLRQRIEAAGADANAERAAPAAALGRPRAAGSEATYLDAVRAAKAWIAAGDVYQVNLSRRLQVRGVSGAELPGLYRVLTERSPAPFSAYLDQGDVTVLSNSPERFLRVVGNRVETCPIKGTRPRGRTPAEDAWLAKDLATSPKDRAEHVMIVDLERNDLGRTCEIGSIRVAKLAEPRSYATVHHLVSSVCGRLRKPADWPALLRATFPGGSITGAPKIRAMQIIDQLETVPRGIYTGALGCFDAAGGVDLSIAIRTAVATGDQLTLHLGGGIVADSDPIAELAETRDKGRAFQALWIPAE